ncbi:hypothetical protein HDU76_012064, partial [Blyttiomyces sp. JEL0837]
YLEYRNRQHRKYLEQIEDCHRLTIRNMESHHDHEIARFIECLERSHKRIEAIHERTIMRLQNQLEAVEKERDKKDCWDCGEMWVENRGAKEVLDADVGGEELNGENRVKEVEGGKWKGLHTECSIWTGKGMDSPESAYSPIPEPHSPNDTEILPPSSPSPIKSARLPFPSEEEDLDLILKCDVNLLITGGQSEKKSKPSSTKKANDHDNKKQEIPPPPTKNQVISIPTAAESQYGKEQDKYVPVTTVVDNDIIENLDIEVEIATEMEVGDIWHAAPTVSSLTDLDELLEELSDSDWEIDCDGIPPMDISILPVVRSVMQPEDNREENEVGKADCPCGIETAKQWNMFLECAQCNRHYHINCIPNLENALHLLGDDFYYLECKDCTKDRFFVQRLYSFRKEQVFSVMYTLSVVSPERGVKFGESMSFPMEVIIEELSKHFTFFNGFEKDHENKKASFKNSIRQNLWEPSADLWAVKTIPQPPELSKMNDSAAKLTRAPIYDIDENGNFVPLNSTRPGTSSVDSERKKRKAADNHVDREEGSSAPSLKMSRTHASPERLVQASNHNSQRKGSGSATSQANSQAKISKEIIKSKTNSTKVTPIQSVNLNNASNNMVMAIKSSASFINKDSQLELIDYQIPSPSTPKLSAYSPEFLAILTSREQDHRRAMEEAEERHRAILASREQDLRRAMEEAVERHRAMLTSREQHHRRALDEAEERQRAMLASRERDYRHAIEEVERQRSILATREHDNRLALEEAEERHRAVLASRKQDYRGAMEEAEERHRAILASREQDHRRAIEDTEERHRAIFASCEQELRRALEDTEERQQARHVERESRHKEEIARMAEFYERSQAKMESVHERVVSDLRRDLVAAEERRREDVKEVEGRVIKMFEQRLADWEAAKGSVTNESKEMEEIKGNVKRPGVFKWLGWSL